MNLPSLAANLMKELIHNIVKGKIAFQAQVSLVLFWVIARLVVGGFNPTYFAVIAEEFTTKGLAENTVVQPPQKGYDGQFFYRYALKPLDKSKVSEGIIVDHPEYRIQRQGYPITVWLMSFGDSRLVPIMMIIANVMAFLFILWLAHYWFYQLGIHRSYTWLFFFVYGIHMAIDRDLAEVFEVLGVLISIYYIWKKNFWQFAISGSLVLLYRETAFVAIAPMAFLFLLMDYQQNKKINFKWLWLTLPAITFIGWKLFIKSYMGIDSGVDGSQNLSFPLWGVIVGAASSLRFNTLKQIAESGIWIMYFIWYVVLIILVIKNSPKLKLNQLNYKQIVFITFILWVGFSTVLGPAIYVDDWGFVRIFSIMNLLGVLTLSFNQSNLPKYFISYSTILMFGTLIRVIVKV